MTPPAGSGTVATAAAGVANPTIGAVAGEAIENISIKPNSVFKGAVITVDLSAVK